MNEANWVEIGKRLREAREYLGFTQAQVAAALGLHRPAVSEIELGRRKVDALELRKLSRLYTVPMASILGEPGGEELGCGLTAGLPASDIKELVRFAMYLRQKKETKSHG